MEEKGRKVGVKEKFGGEGSYWRHGMEFGVKGGCDSRREGSGCWWNRELLDEEVKDGR